MILEVKNIVTGKTSGISIEPGQVVDTKGYQAVRLTTGSDSFDLDVPPEVTKLTFNEVLKELGYPGRYLRVSGLVERGE